MQQCPTICSMATCKSREASDLPFVQFPQRAACEARYAVGAAKSAFLAELSKHVCAFAHHPITVQ